MSLFDAKSFLSATLSEANATKSIPLPVEQRVSGQVMKVDIMSGEKDGKTWYRFETTLEITDPEYLAKWPLDDGKAERATIRLSFPLDVNEGGGIAMGPGRNVQLGRFREATGTNQPGKALDACIGSMIRFDVANRPNPNDPEIVFAEAKNPVKY